MNRTITIVAAVLMLSGVRTDSAFAQTASDLFQQALRKERLDGDLNAAIALYQRILKEHAVNRSITSRALVQLGAAYEKQGNAAARSAYERVVREYADQREQAAIANARLSALASDDDEVRKASGQTLRRLWSDAPGAVGGTTPDGRVLTFVDRSTGRLGVRDVRAGTNRWLTEGPSRPWATYALAGVPSPDGQQIVYPWYTEQRTVELRIIDARGGIPRVLHANAETEYVAPMDWSRDGKRILLLLVRKGRIGQIATVSVADGRITVLKTLGWRGAQSPMSFSPDGRFIAYSVPPSTETEQRDIFVLASDGSSEAVLVRRPGDETVLGWTPDGAYVFFASRESGQQSLWLAPVVNGKAAGESILARRDGDNVQPVGFTLGGAFVYTTPSPSHIRTVVARLDSSATDSSVRISSAVDRSDAWAAQWSHDGKTLVYASQASAAPIEGVQLIVRNVSSGAERIVRSADLAYAYTIRWSPDDTYLMVTGQDKKGRRGIFRVDPAIGSATLVIPAAAGAEAVFAGWSTDGRSVIYTGVDPQDRRTFGAVVRKNAVDGTEQEIVRAGTTQLGRPKLSPDGSRLAFVDVDSGGQPDKRLRIVALGSATVKDLVRVPNGSSIGALAWSPSGNELYYVLVSRGQGSHPNRRLMRVAGDGGDPIDTGIQFDGGVIALQIHPDGEQLLCTIEVGADLGRDVWVMENFLPPSTLQKKSGSK